MSSRTNSQAAAQSEATSRERSRCAHVLVVDDKEMVRTFLAEVLDMAGHRVSVAESGDDALAIAAKDAPAVVVTDLRMEPMGGDELIEKLRTTCAHAVPIVLTGYGSVERTVRLMRIGAFDVLTKPCRGSDLVATVEQAIEQHRALEGNGDPRKRLEARKDKRQLLQEKLAMIGKLAAGVAHELNNPLDATLRCVRLSKDRVQNDPETTEYLDLAHAGLLRMADIVQTLLKFSREAAFEQAPQRLDELVQEAVTGVSLALGGDAPAVTQDLNAGVAGVHIPRGMHQVITNLLRNAADAAPGRRKIHIRGHLEGDRIVLDVRDDGPGIPADVLPRVFEPFFTTKEPGHGTGLGLPISARLVEKFGGSLSIECPADGGTLVSVSLPASRYATERGEETL